MMSNKIALLFPGQGAQNPQMLEGIKDHNFFKKNYQVISDILKKDVLKEIKNGNTSFLDDNLASSILTVFVSTIYLEIYQEKNSLPKFMSGYSVGQWTSLYAAKMIDFNTLVNVLDARCNFMNQALSEIKSGMVAVIGIKEEIVKEVCSEINSSGHFIEISNFNCVGQYSLSGEEVACQKALIILEKYNPKKLLRIPVSGAWHSKLLKSAENEFLDWLKQIEIKSTDIALINNVTGELLPKDPHYIKHDLAKHISHPVLWNKGVKKLISMGCEEFIEIGYGATLTKFGFFIDRQSKFISFNIN